MAPSVDAVNGIPATNGTTNGATNGATAPSPSSNPIPAWAGPDLTRLLEVQHGENYTTRAISKVTLPPHALFARITSATPAPSAAYTTVQSGPSSHIELNSDLVYINHSCAPNAGLRFTADGVFLTALQPIPAGEEIAWDYSTTLAEPDWSMQCGCGSPQCRGVVRAFALLPAETQDRYRALGIVAPYLDEPAVAVRAA